MREPLRRRSGSQVGAKKMKTNGLAFQEDRVKFRRVTKYNMEARPRATLQPKCTSRLSAKHRSKRL